MEMAANDDIIKCDALRVLPKPTLINVSPAAAMGTRNIRMMQVAVAASESPGAGIGVMLYPLGELSENESRV
jgi:hypothetical protein